MRIATNTMMATILAITLLACNKSQDKANAVPDNTKQVAPQDSIPKDVWTNIQHDQFQKALEQADREYQQTGDIFLLRNKVLALLHLKQYTEAVTLSEFLLKESGGEIEADFITCGIAHWSMKNRNQAIDVWKSAENSTYTDAAGGIELQIILYFAGLQAQDEKLKSRSLKKIKELAEGEMAINWPGALGSYLLEEITEEEVERTIPTIPILKARGLCQKSFVDAIKALERNDKNAYIGALQACTGTHYRPHSYVESLYYLAKGELENIE